MSAVGTAGPAGQGVPSCAFLFPSEGAVNGVISSFYFPSPFKILAHDAAFLFGLFFGIPFGFLSSGDCTRVISFLVRSACLSTSGDLGAFRVAVRRRHATLPAYLDTIRIHPCFQLLLFRIPLKCLRCLFSGPLFARTLSNFFLFCCHISIASTDIFIKHNTIISILHQLFYTDRLIW